MTLLIPESKEAGVAQRQRLEDMVKSVGAVLGERKRLERVEKKLVSTLNKALAKIGYKVIPAKAVAKKGRRRRRGRRATGTARRRRVTGTARGRRKAGAARRRGRAKKR